MTCEEAASPTSKAIARRFPLTLVSHLSILFWQRLTYFQEQLDRIITQRVRQAVVQAVGCVLAVVFAVVLAAWFMIAEYTLVWRAFRL